MSSNISIGQSAQALYENAAIKSRMGYAVDSGGSVSINSGQLGQSDTLSVESTEYWFDGSDVSSATQNIQIDAPDPDDPRKDVVYLDGTGTAQVAKGTPAEPPQEQADLGAERFEFYQPVPPALDTTDATVLAEVWVEAGATSISSSDVAHRRQFATVLPSLEANVDAKGHEISNVGNLGSADGFASLNSDGVLTSSEVPDLSITSTYTVADESERLALDVEEGDVAIQDDNETTYIFTGGDSSDDSNWSEIVFDVLGAIDGETITPHEIQNQNYVETPNVVADAGSTQTLDLATSNQWKITLTADCTIDFSNGVDGASLTLYVEQDGTGGHSITWPTVLVPDGDEPSITSDADAIDRVVFDRIDGDWFLTKAGSDFASSS